MRPNRTILTFCTLLIAIPLALSNAGYANQPTANVTKNKTRTAAHATHSPVQKGARKPPQNNTPTASGKKPTTSPSPQIAAGPGKGKGTKNNQGSSSQQGKGKGKGSANPIADTQLHLNSPNDPATDAWNYSWLKGKNQLIVGHEPHPNTTSDDVVNDIAKRINKKEPTPEKIRKELKETGSVTVFHPNDSVTDYFGDGSRRTRFYDPKGSKETPKTEILHHVDGTIDIFQDQDWLQINGKGKVLRRKDGMVYNWGVDGNLGTKHGPGGLDDDPQFPKQTPRDKSQHQVIDPSNPGFFTNGKTIPGVTGGKDRSSYLNPFGDPAGDKTAGGGTGSSEKKYGEGSIGGNKSMRDDVAAQLGMTGNHQSSGSDSSGGKDSGSDSGSGSSHGNNFGSGSTNSQNDFPKDNGTTAGNDSGNSSSTSGSSGSTSSSGNSGQTTSGGSSTGTDTSSSGNGSGSTGNSSGSGSGSQPPPHLDFGDTDFYTNSDSSKDDGYRPAPGSTSGSNGSGSSGTSGSSGGSSGSGSGSSGSSGSGSSGSSGSSSGSGSSGSSGSGSSNSGSGSGSDSSNGSSKTGGGSSDGIPNPDAPVVHRDPATTAALMNRLRGSIGRNPNTTDPSSDDDTGDGSQWMGSIRGAGTTSRVPKGKGLITNPSGAAPVSAGSSIGERPSPAPNGNIINPGQDAVDSPSQQSGPPIQNKADNVGGDSGNQQAGSGQHLATPPQNGSHAGSSGSSSSTTKQKLKQTDIRSILERLQKATKATGFYG